MCIVQPKFHCIVCSKSVYHYFVASILSLSLSLTHTHTHKRVHEYFQILLENCVLCLHENVQVYVHCMHYQGKVLSDCWKIYEQYVTEELWND